MARRVILVDTSAWVEFDRKTASAVDIRLTQLITDEGPIAVTEPVVMEVLAGARTDARERDLCRLLQRFHLHRVDPTPGLRIRSSHLPSLPPERNHPP